MRKRNIRFISLAMLSCLALASCTRENSNSKISPSASASASSSNSASASNSNSSSASASASASKETDVISDKTTIVETTKSYGLALDVSEGASVTFDEPSETMKFVPGSTISFKVTLSKANLVIDKVSVNDREIEADSPLSYSFVMPRMDSTLKVTVKEVGSLDVLTVSDVVESEIPLLDKASYTDAAALKTYATSLQEYLKKSDAAEMEYMSSAEFTSSKGGFDFFGPLFRSDDSKFKSLKFAGSEQSIMVESLNGGALRYSAVLRGSTSYSSTYSSFERGLDNDRYYERYDELNSDGKEERAYTVLYSLVDDATEDAKVNRKKEIKESDANVNVASARFGSLTSSEFANSSVSKSFAYVSSGKLQNKVNDISYSLAQDKKSVTFHLDYYWFSYGTVYQKVFDVKVDGNHLLNQVTYTSTKFDKKDYDTETSTMKADAVGTLDGEYTLKVNRGFKVDEKKCDISQYRMMDYSLSMETKLPGQSSKMVTDNTVENGATINGFFFAPNESEQDRSYMGLITPTLVGTRQGEEDFLEKNTNGKYVVKKEGVFHLTFDNGFGETKEFEVNSVRPNPYKIETDAPDFLFIGDTTKFHVSVSPESAIQDVVCKVNEDDLTGAVLTDKGNGDFEISAAREGSFSVEISSKADPNIKLKHKFDVYTKPDAASILANLKDKSLKGNFEIEDSSGWGSKKYDAVINFEPDETGKAGTAKVLFKREYGSDYQGTFKWSFDETSLSITVTEATGVGYSGEKVVGVSVITSDKFSVKFTDGTAVLTFGDKEVIA